MFLTLFVFRAFCLLLPLVVILIGNDASQNNGTCEDGTRLCPREGYGGDNCEQPLSCEA
ncbi:MAG: hypothetical protein IPN94_12005 [Sphingobacteriales bacterium]|nr:hypothetical protein [Sphingobacteriales bacterium]